jgi:hypothetical protein
MSTITNHEEVAFTPVIEPNTQKWLDELAAAAAAGAPPLYELTPQDARAVLRDVQASVEVPLLPADIEDRVISGGPAGEVRGEQPPSPRCDQGDGHLLTRRSLSDL